MNILILTGRFGMGHYSASDAVKQEIEGSYKDANIQIVDIVNYLLPEFSNTIYGGFNILATYLWIVYNAFNKVADKCNSMPLKNVVSKKLDNLIEEYSPDLIISTLAMSSQYISEYKNIRELDIPLYTFITDISSHDEWIAENTDIYFVASKSIKDKFIKNGIPDEKIKITGIPVKQSFKTERVESKEQRNKELLIMGGGLGIIPQSSHILNTLDAMLTINTTVIVGSNTKMYKKLKKKYKNIKVIGYTDRVSEYMKKADLVITKAGGITIFEAIHCETPMYITKPFLAQEIKNARYIEVEELGRVSWENGRDIAFDILGILGNKEYLLKVKDNMKKIKNEISNVSIASEIATTEEGA